ncbi:MAG TPA: hypothetical protein VG346_04955 [Acidimicrobiales bacterium]|jgi:hypothetical protein|nr:hypothetical protein [Acidimicrobiales bacterium]
MRRISPQDVAAAMEKRLRLRPAVVHPVSALEIRQRVQRCYFGRRPPR